MPYPPPCLCILPLLSFHLKSNFSLFLSFSLSFLCVVLGIKPGVLRMLGKCTSSELHAQLSAPIFNHPDHSEARIILSETPTGLCVQCYIHQATLWPPLGLLLKSPSNLWVLSHSVHCAQLQVLKRMRVYKQTKACHCSGKQNKYMNYS